MPPQSASVVAAVISRPTVPGAAKLSRRWPWRRARMRGGAAESRSSDASMFRVTMGSARVRRTSTATAWHAKCRA